MKYQKNKNRVIRLIVISVIALIFLLPSNSSTQEKWLNEYLAENKCIVTAKTNYFILVKSGLSYEIIFNVEKPLSRFVNETYNVNDTIKLIIDGNTSNLPN